MFKFSTYRQCNFLIQLSSETPQRCKINELSIGILLEYVSSSFLIFYVEVRSKIRMLHPISISSPLNNNTVGIGSKENSRNELQNLMHIQNFKMIPCQSIVVDYLFSNDLFKYALRSRDPIWEKRTKKIKEHPSQSLY